jgi:hypothetical protein
LIILIGSESINNFIDEQVVRSIKAATIKTTIIAVTVANGNIMLCDSHVPVILGLMQQ